MSKDNRHNNRGSGFNSSITRRVALLLIGSGAITWIKSSGAEVSIEADRLSDVSVGSDDDSLIRLTGFDDTKVFTEPHVGCHLDETDTLTLGLCV